MEDLRNDLFLKIHMSKVDSDGNGRFVKEIPCEKKHFQAAGSILGIWPSIVSYYSVLYGIILYDIILYYNVLYCIVLYCVML